MCGRFALGIPKPVLEELLNVPLPDTYRPRFNVAPTLIGLVVADQGALLARWGLIPPWADSPTAGSKLINARQETVFAKPAFRAAVARFRCLVPAQAFYEWKVGGPTRHPYAVGLESGSVFAMAGITSQWQDPDTGEVLESFAVLTREAAGIMCPIHHRMPMILDPDNWSAWINPKTPRPELETVLARECILPLRAWPVSPMVNNPAHDGPELLAPFALTPSQGRLI